MEPTKIPTEPEPLIGKDITENGTGKIKVLVNTDKTAVICLFFPYDIVTPVTIANAMNDAAVRMNRYSCRFDPETPPTQKQRRMDSDFVRKKYPEWVAMAEAIKLDLKSYILLRLGESSNYGKKGKLPPDQRPPGETRRTERRKTKKKDKRFTAKKKKRK